MPASRLLALLALPLLLLAPAPFRASPSALPSPSLAPLSRAERAVAEHSINTLGAKLYARLGERATNLLLSPASAALALGLASAGADGETLSEMRAALSHTLEPGRQHAALARLARRWSSFRDQGLRVSSANRLFGSAAVPFAPEYLAWSARTYDAPLERLDFGAPAAAAARVNRWIESSTNRRIRDAVGPEAFDDPAALVLVNALYFRARWQHEFAREATRPRTFWIRGTDRGQVPTMATEAYFLIAKRKTGSVLELPYLGGAFSMYVLLPRDRDGIDKMEEECLRPRLDECLGHLKEENVDLRLPRFRIETRVSLNQALRSLGMNRAFDRARADFKAMAPSVDSLFLGELVQKVYVAVDEEGTEAAAATLASFGVGDMPPPPIPFHVDHPFLFLIVDRTEGAVMFVGRVTDPRR